MRVRVVIPTTLDITPTACTDGKLKVVFKWIAKSLSRKLIVGLTVIMIAASTLFLVHIIWLYHDKLIDERAAASVQVNLLLQATLENAMLKHDLPGLSSVVQSLGCQEDIQRVMIANPQHQVRFSSDRKMLNRVLDPYQLTGRRHQAGLEKNSKKPVHFTLVTQSERVIRSVNTIRNKLPCTTCHGSLKDNPINGLLIVDISADGIIRQTAYGAAGLAASGLVVILLAISAVWLFLKRAVITPVERLNSASLLLADGDLSTRVPCDSSDQLARLCGSFNVMATRLQGTLRTNQKQRIFMQELIDSIPDGIRVIDQQFKMVMANKAFCSQLHLNPDEIKGSACYGASHGRTEPCPPSLVTCPVYEIRTTGKSIKVVHRHKRSDDSQFHVEVVAAPLAISPDGEDADLIIESVRDLEKQAMITQEQRLSELGQLAAGVAHEIHNPLFSVRLGLRSILRSLEKGSLPDTSIGFLKQVDGEIDKCIDVTKRLLDLSIPPSKRIQLVSLETIIPEVASLLNFEAKKAGIEWKIDLQDSGLRVLATDSEMRMLTLNLIQNAFHAMPKGGLLKIRGRADAGKVVIVFEDNGAGINDEDMAYIFDPFFSRRADNQEGTGLGLTICRSIVKRYEGHIHVDSRFGERTVFTVTMPMADGESCK
jgi:signal transduction histidine kinase/HAMP domain-containing protein